jgi:hypothetical protein
MTCNNDTSTPPPPRYFPRPKGTRVIQGAIPADFIAQN